jgi:hypothetical protein
MAERKYTCKVKCYYLSRLWYPTKGEKSADILITDRTDVPLEYFTPEVAKKKQETPKE